MPSLGCSEQLGVLQQRQYCKQGNIEGNRKIFNICKIVFAKEVLFQILQEIAEEHDALIQEKSQSEEDIVKLENKLQELVETLEIEARKQHENFGTQYTDIPAECREVFFIREEGFK